MGEMASWSPGTPQPLDILLWSEPPRLAGELHPLKASAEAGDALRQAPNEEFAPQPSGLGFDTSRRRGIGMRKLKRCVQISLISAAAI
jgi:hypothetical protein